MSHSATYSPLTVRVKAGARHLVFHRRSFIGNDSLAAEKAAKVRAELGAEFTVRRHGGSIDVYHADPEKVRIEDGFALLPPPIIGGGK